MSKFIAGTWRALGLSRATFQSEMTASLEEVKSIPISMRNDDIVRLMVDPKPEEDDLTIPSFLDRRKPEPKPDRKAAMEKLVERKPPPVELDA